MRGIGREARGRGGLVRPVDSSDVFPPQPEAPAATSSEAARQMACIDWRIAPRFRGSDPSVFYPLATSAYIT